MHVSSWGSQCSRHSCHVQQVVRQTAAGPTDEQAAGGRPATLRHLQKPPSGVLAHVAEERLVLNLQGGPPLHSEWIGQMTASGGLVKVMCSYDVDDATCSVRLIGLTEWERVW